MGGTEEAVDGEGLPCIVERRFTELVPPLREDFAEWVPVLTGEEIESVVVGDLLVFSFFSVVAGPTEAALGVFVGAVMVLLEEGGLLGATELTEAGFKVDGLRSAAVILRSGDFGVGVLVARVEGTTEALLEVVDDLVAASLSPPFVDGAFFTAPPVVPEGIAGRVGGLFNPATACAVPGGPVRDLRDPVAFAADGTRLGAAEVVDAAFFLSTIRLSGPVLCPSLSVSWPFRP